MSGGAERQLDVTNEISYIANHKMPKFGRIFSLISRLQRVRHSFIEKRTSASIDVARPAINHLEQVGEPSSALGPGAKPTREIRSSTGRRSDSRILAFLGSRRQSCECSSSRDSGAVATAMPATAAPNGSIRPADGVQDGTRVHEQPSPRARPLLDSVPLAQGPARVLESCNEVALCAVTISMPMERSFSRTAAGTTATAGPAESGQVPDSRACGDDICNRHHCCKHASRAGQDDAKAHITEAAGPALYDKGEGSEAKRCLLGQVGGGAAVFCSKPGPGTNMRTSAELRRQVPRPHVQAMPAKAAAFALLVQPSKTSMAACSGGSAITTSASAASPLSATATVTTTSSTSTSSPPSPPFATRAQAKAHTHIAAALAARAGPGATPPSHFRTLAAALQAAEESASPSPTQSSDADAASAGSSAAAACGSVGRPMCQGGPPGLVTEPPVEQEGKAEPGPNRLLAMSPGTPAAMRRGQWSLKDYSVRRRLFQSPTSSVYEATCNPSGLPVALKVYNLALVPLNVLHMLWREIQIQASFSHLHVVMLYGAFQDTESNRLVLVEELASNGDLNDVHRSLGCRMSENQARVLVLQPLLEAVTTLHASGVVHRDIKPDNILFTADWRLVLADFGVSINTSLERAVTRAGTVGYMAPEVERCPLKALPEENKEALHLAYTIAADVWAIGCLAYMLILGFPPFLTSSLGEGGRRSGGESGFTSALTFPASTSLLARDFICSALAEEPEERPTALQLAGHPWMREQGL